MKDNKLPFVHKGSSDPISLEKHQDTITSCFGALCFFLSTIEYLIPKPLPFLRLGLANLPIMLAIEVLPLPYFFILVFIKLLGQALLGGTLFSYIFFFALASTLVSAATMLIAKKIFKDSISFIGVSIIGALSSNLIQLLLARLFIFGEGTWFIAMPMIVLGSVTGTLLGVFANHFAKESQWYALTKKRIEFCVPWEDTPSSNKQENKRTLFVRLITGAILLMVLLFSSSLLVKGLTFLCIVLLIVVDSIRVNILSIIMVSIGIIFFNLFIPHGKVLFEIWNFTITEGALASGIKKALVLEGMIMVSKWMLQTRISLPGRLGNLVSNAFSTMHYLLSNKALLNPKNVVASIDELMCARVRVHQGPHDNQDAT